MESLPAPTPGPRPFEERLLAQLERLQRLADRRVGPSAADDLVQETLLRAWRGRTGFDPARDLWPWLKTVAENAAVRRLEIETRQRATDLRDADDRETLVDASFELEREPPFDVRPFLDRLGKDEREVVERFYFAGASIADIARDRSCPEGTVKSQLSRARRRLAGMLVGIGLGASAILWPVFSAGDREPDRARLAYHSVSVELVQGEPAQFARRDLSQPSDRGWTVVIEPTVSTPSAPTGAKRP